MARKDGYHKIYQYIYVFAKKGELVRDLRGNNWGSSTSRKDTRPKRQIN
jgi:hypothetical protein